MPGPLSCYQGWIRGFGPAVPAHVPSGGLPAPEGPVARAGTRRAARGGGASGDPLDRRPGPGLRGSEPGTLFAELAQEDDAPTVTVLGEETADFGPIVPMEENYIVQFSIERKGVAVPRHPCSLWSLNEYGLPLNELLRVAEGLQRT